MPANITTWPYPRIISTPYRSLGFFRLASTNLLFVAEASYSSGSWSFFAAGALEPASTSPRISIADFGPFYIVSIYSASDSIRAVTYVRDVSESVAYACLIRQENPSWGTCCNHKGQLVAGNIYSPSVSASNYWDDLGTNGFLWSAIGSFSIDPSTNLGAGMGQLFANQVSGPKAILHKLMSLGDTVIAYTDAGNVPLIPAFHENSFAYGSGKPFGLGVRSAHHVDGDGSCQGFVDLANEFWLLEAPLNLTRLGYKEWIDELTGDMIVTYIPRRKTFYISNGTKCVVINEYGAYHAHQLPASVVLAPDGVLYGTYMDNEDDRGLIVTEPTDFNSRGLKSVESILADIDTSVDASTSFAVDWRVSTGASFQRSGLVPGGPTAEGHIGVTALDFRVVVEVSSYLQCEVNNILANVKYSDQRFKRGTVPSQYTMGSA